MSKRKSELVGWFLFHSFFVLKKKDVKNLRFFEWMKGMRRKVEGQMGGRRRCGG